MHFQKSGHFFSFPLARIVNLAAGLDLSRIDSQVCHLAAFFLHDLECQRGKRFLIAADARLLRLGQGMDPLDGRDILRRRQVGHHRIKNRLNTLVSECRPAHHGDGFQRKGCLPDGLQDILLGKRHALQVSIREIVIPFGQPFQHFLAVGIHLGFDFLGNLGKRIGHSQCRRIPGQQLLANQVDDAVEVLSLAPGNLHRQGF